MDNKRCLWILISVGLGLVVLLLGYQGTSQEKEGNNKAFWTNSVQGIAASLKEEEAILINGAVPLLVKGSENKEPGIDKGCQGGIDEGCPGDKEGYIIAASSAPWGPAANNPRTITVFFALDEKAEKVGIEIGYRNGGGTPRSSLCLDKVPIGSLKEEPREGLKKEELTIFKNPDISAEGKKIHTLEIIQYHRTWLGAMVIDAIKIHGKGIKLLNPETLSVISAEEIKRLTEERQSHLPKNFSLPENCLAFDFGSPSSPVWEKGGFKRVTDKDIYNKEKGHGWVDPRNSLVSGEISDSDILRGDYVYASSGSSNKITDIEFKIDLPNGDYGVFVIAGGLPDLKRYSIKAEGKLALHIGFIDCRDSVLDKPAIIHNSFPVKIADDQLNLCFCNATNFIINGMVIYPLSERKKAEQELFRLIDDYYLPVCSEVKGEEKVKMKKEDLGKLEATLDPGFKVKEREALPISQKDKERGYVIFVNNYLRLIYPHSLPLQGEDTNKISLFATPGEYEPMTLSVRGLKKLKDIKLEVSDLANGRARISKENIDIRAVRHHRMSITTWPTGKYKIAPWALVKDIPEEIDKEFTQEFWLTAKIPSDAKPGNYKGKICFKAEGVSPSLLDINLEVFPFQLEKPKDKWVAMGWYGSTYYQIYWEENLERVFEDMQEHGITGLGEQSGTTTPEVSLKDGKLYFDFTRVKEMMELKKRYGFTAPVKASATWSRITSSLGYELHTPEFETAWKEMIKAIVEEVKKNNWPEIIFWPVDEPGSGPLLDKAKYLLGIIKQVPGARTLITVDPSSARTLDPWLDIRCYNQYSQKEIDETKAAGDTFWFYSGVYGENIVDKRLGNGLYFWKVDAAYMCYWVYCWPKGNPWFDLDNDERETGAIIPSADGPIPTIQWEGIREGIDDLNYIYTLTSLIEKASSSEKKRVKEKVKKAKSLIDEILSAIKVGNKGFGESLAEIPLSAYDQWRYRMAKTIMELMEIQNDVK